MKNKMKIKMKIKMKNKSIKSETMFLLFSITVGICFFFFIGDRDYILFEDSQMYLNPTQFIKERYILYPIFLKLCRTIWGTENYLRWITYLQGALAIIISFVIANIFKKYYLLSYMESFIVYVLQFLPYAYSLPENVATHHILTEGVTYSIFHLFVATIVFGFLQKNTRKIIVAIFYMVLLILLRSQMIVLLPIYFILLFAFFYVNNKERDKKKGLKNPIYLLLFVVMVLLFVLFKMIATGKLTQMTTALSGRVFCTMSEEDIESFDGDENKIAKLIFEKMKAERTTAEYFDESNRYWENIAIGSNKNTSIIRESTTDYYISYLSERIDDGINRIIASLTVTLLKKNFFEYILMTLALCGNSLVISTFIQPNTIYGLCNIISVCIYSFSILLLWYNKKKIILNQYRVPFIITTFILLCNVVTTNLFFYGMQRYVVYTFGFFYISVYIMMIGIIRNRKGAENEMLNNNTCLQ